MKPWTQERDRQALAIIQRQGYSDQEAARRFGVSVRLIKAIKARNEGREEG